MATESVTPLSLDSIDRMGELLDRSKGIAELLVSAGASEADIPSSALMHASITMSNMLTEAHNILHGKMEA